MSGRAPGQPSRLPWDQQLEEEEARQAWAEETPAATPGPTSSAHPAGGSQRCLELTRMTRPYPPVWSLDVPTPIPAWERA